MGSDWKKKKYLDKNQINNKLSLKEEEEEEDEDEEEEN